MSDDHTPCPACDGQGEPLGALGSLMHYRCRQCGWTFVQDDDSPEIQSDMFS